MEWLYVGIAIVGAVIGWLFSRYTFKKRLQTLEEQAAKEAKTIIEEAQQRAQTLLKEAELKAETQKNQKIQQAQEKYAELQIKLEKQIAEQQAKLKSIATALEQKEQMLQEQQRSLEEEQKRLEAFQETLKQQAEQLEQRLAAIEQLRHEEIAALEKIAGISAQEARKDLIEKMKQEARSRAMREGQRLLEESKMKAAQEAQKILTNVIQRTSLSHHYESMVTVIKLDDDMKGRIIGKEGRNIRVFESLTGCEIIIDDTPNTITVSCHDAYRRAIATLALKKLIADGRIHPARIEEIVEKVKEELDKEVQQVGERTVIELGIHGLHPELIKMVGKMKYRYSYGQNLLHHSKEVAILCGLLAAELGLDVKAAKRAGLLHDIGKLIATNEHALVGMRLAEQYGESPEVCNAIGAHHEEIEKTCLIAYIVQAADAISGARPGARREMYERYIQRLKDLENIALTFQGVTKAYAIQGGRELRVLVDSEQINDQQTEQMALEIAKKIEEQLVYPGQIQVTVIREKRGSAVAC